MAFGRPTRYLQLDLNRIPITSSSKIFELFGINLLNKLIGGAPAGNGLAIASPRKNLRKQ